MAEQLDIGTTREAPRALGRLLPGSRHTRDLLPRLVLRDQPRASRCRRPGGEPGHRALAITLGALIIVPPFVSEYRTIRSRSALGRLPLLRPRLRLPAVRAGVRPEQPSTTFGGAWLRPRDGPLPPSVP